MTRELEDIFEIECFHGERAARDFNDRGVAKILGELCRIQCRAHENQFQIRSTREQTLENNEEKIAVEVTLVNLIDEDV